MTCCEKERHKCGLIGEAYWCLTDEELVHETTSCCNCCRCRVDLCLCFVISAIGLAVFAFFYIVFCCAI